MVGLPPALGYKQKQKKRKQNPVWTVLLSVLSTKWTHKSRVKAPAHTRQRSQRQSWKQWPLPSVLATFPPAWPCPLGAFYMITTKGLQAGTSCRNPSSYPQSLGKTKAKGNEEGRVGTGILFSVCWFNPLLCLSSLSPEEHIQFCRCHQMYSVYFLMWDPGFPMFLPLNFALFSLHDCCACFKASLIFKIKYKPISFFFFPWNSNEAVLDPGGCFETSWIAIQKDKF